MHRQQINMSPKVLLNQLYRYIHNNLCHSLHKIIAITFKQTCKIDVLLTITNSNPCGKCLSRQLFTITNSIPCGKCLSRQLFTINNSNSFRLCCCLCRLDYSLPSTFEFVWFHFFEYERTWRIFQKRFMCTKSYIYVFHVLNMFYDIKYWSFVLYKVI